jgi:hypothetical protein
MHDDAVFQFDIGLYHRLTANDAVANGCIVDHKRRDTGRPACSARESAAEDVCPPRLP